jgi:hypothetical protein
MPALLRQRVDPELVARVRADDRQPALARQRAGAAGVVDVGVGQPDLLEVEPEFVHRRQQQRQVAAGVDDRGLARGSQNSSEAFCWKAVTGMVR